MANHGTIWYVHPYAGGPGVGRYSRPYFLARHWRAQGVRATIFTPAYHHLLDVPQVAGARAVESVPYEFVPGNRYKGNGVGRLRNMAEFSARLYWNAQKYADRCGKPDMIVASSPHPYAFLATHAIARKFGARSVFEVRDLWPLSMVELAGTSPAHPLVRFTGWLERRAYSEADFVVSLLPCTQQYMGERGLSAARWQYIPNGVHPDERALRDDTQPCVQQARRWKNEGRTVIVYAGALGRPNHVDSLIKALARLQEQGDTTVAAIIVGRGELESELQELIRQAGLENRVALFGQIPKQAVLSLLQEADAGYISLRPEPLFRFGVSPNKLFDYMLASIPVIFAVSAGNDPVAEARCGISINPGDPEAIALALLKVASMPLMTRAEMGARGRSYVLENHGYDVLARRYLELLDIPRGV